MPIKRPTLKKKAAPKKAASKKAAPKKAAPKKAAPKKAASKKAAPKKAAPKKAAPKKAAPKKAAPKKAPKGGAAGAPRVGASAAGATSSATGAAEAGQSLAEAMASLWDPQRWLKPWGLDASSGSPKAGAGDGDGGGAGATSPWNPSQWLKLWGQPTATGFADMAERATEAAQAASAMWDPSQLTKLWNMPGGDGDGEAGDSPASPMAALFDPQRLMKMWAGMAQGQTLGLPSIPGASPLMDPQVWLKLASSGPLSSQMTQMTQMLPQLLAAAMPGGALPSLSKAFDPSQWMAQLQSFGQAQPWLAQLQSLAQAQPGMSAAQWMQPQAWAQAMPGAMPGAVPGATMDPQQWMKPWLSMMPGLAGQTSQLPTFGLPMLDTLTSWMTVMQGLTGGDTQRLAHDAREYWVDFAQRCVLYMDTMRQRGNIMLEHHQAGKPPLLAYEYDLVSDARDFERPCNYQLLRIRHPEGKKPAPGRRPVVIIDPRAGHGPGIGGFKQDSEVGMGLTEGHPVYFVSFTPEPVPGQTIEDVEQAEVQFIEEVNRLHPDRDVPLVYGNCQAGWAVAMLGADRPDVTGPIVINGAPMSYWAGGAGINPMRLAGGLTGGAWATRFLCDLGGGIFDGSHLVHNFENLNPANTLWGKEYRLFSHVDTEPPRYLEFERWWTGFFLMNEDEILWIVNNLFMGDKLEQGKLSLGPNHAIDMKNMDDPLVIFASSGDNITPPQQALHWISELYPTTDELKAAGQRIIYMINPHIGHLGIFVSAKIARREHRAIIEHIENIRSLPPGLYEMIIERETGEKDPLKDQFEVSFAERRIKDVKFPVEQGAFERMLAVSRANEALYLQLGRPWVKQMMSGVNPEVLRWLSPMRVSRYIFSDRVNPFMKAFELWAGQVKAQRQVADESNAYRYAERRMSDNIVALLDAYRDVRDSMSELTFDMMYSKDRTP